MPIMIPQMIPPSSTRMRRVRSFQLIAAFVCILLSLVVLNNDNLVRVTATIVVPENVASWVPVSTSGTSPPPTCDHSTVKLEDRLFMFYGGDDTDNFYSMEQDIYVLDTRNGDDTVAPWSTLSFTTSTRPNVRAAATAVANSNNGHVTMFGGYMITSPTYLDDLWVLAINLSSLSNADSSTWQGSWHVVRAPSVNGESNGGPLSRAWTRMVFVDPAMTTMILYGGLGSATDDVGTILDKDQSDTWLLNGTLIDLVVDGILSLPPVNANTRLGPEWSTIVNATCLETMTDCTDTSEIMTRWPEFADYSVNLTDLIASSARASDMTNLLIQLRDLASSLSTAADTQAASWTTDPANANGNCTIQCLQKATLSNQPRPSEGHRAVVVNGIYFQFGGYACTTEGTYGSGGPSCYDNTMYMLDIAGQQWFALTEPTDTSSKQATLWPTPRAYHTMVHHEGKLYVFGGGYKDQTAVMSYYSDVHVFNIATIEWEAITISGSIPPVRWSHSATIIGDNMWVLAGCAQGYYNDVYVLKLGARMLAANCSASIYGKGLVGLAGVTTSFTIQTRSSRYVNRTLVWGDALKWGTSLSFDVRLISTAATAQCQLTSTEVIELGDGLYNVTFTPELGATQLLNVFLDADHIPGSPFAFTLLPATPVADLSAAAGVGLKSTVKGETSSFLVTLADVYGNSATSGGDADSLVAMVDNVVVTSSVHDYGNGTYQITYNVPASSDTFDLVVEYKSAPILGSPFTVTGYNQLAVAAPLKWAIVGLATIACLTCFLGILFIIWQRNNKVMRASSPLFMVIILTGALIGLTSVFPLVTVNDNSCQAFQWLLGLGFTIMLSCVYAKAWRISTIFTSTVLLL
jgi:hypothetical protein